MEITRADDIATFSAAGVSSRQLLFPENSKSERITVTRVVMQPGAINPPHRHPTSEQIWVALRGTGHLIVEGDARVPFVGGDVARFADNDLHGFENTGTTEFEYLSVTSPPINFRDAYAKPWTQDSKTDQ
ncbi:MAG: cupin domain-containing protein [Betaproteobacteria bacterium]|nr:cupin domain-containing protein [Betaproteobacteria bacterium]